MPSHLFRYAALVAAGVILGAASAVLLSPDFGAGTPAPEAAKPGPRSVLYYKNPMGHPDTSPVPKKDSMGMDYIPVYEGEDDDAGAVKVSRERIQMLGVRLETVTLRRLTRAVRAAGTIQIDEARQAVLATRAEGWIERMYVARTGDHVRRGQMLAEIYSPDLVRAQQDYLLTPAAAARADERDGALQRLRNFGVAEEDIARLVRERRVSRLVPVRAPIDGDVVEKKAVAGMRGMPGDLLYKIVDHSVVWAIAEIFEQDLAWIAEGQTARVSIVAAPGEFFAGRVAYVYPQMNAATRTARVRIELPNPGGRLKPDMFAAIEIAASDAKAPVVAVPTSAVIDGGTRRVVLVERGEGRFEPRSVKLGRRAGGYVEVIEGVAEGERVVVSANFLIDAESNLNAALRGLTDESPPTGNSSPESGETVKP